MKKIETPKFIEPWKIICAAQSEPDYSEERQILFYNGEAWENDKYGLIQGGHCSCYGWEEVSWDCVEYTKEELIKLAENNQSHCYHESEKLFWKLVLIAIC